MPINNIQWRVEIRIFKATSEVRYFKKKSLWVAVSRVFFFSFGFRFVFILLILFACGDIELIQVLKTGTPATFFQSVIEI